MKNKYRILKIGITVIILGFLLSFSLNKFSKQKITDNKISVIIHDKDSVDFLDEKDVIAIVNKDNPSRSVGDLNIPELEKKINALPDVDSANVYLNLNGKLNIEIKQRIPIFRLNSNGKDFYVDEKGIEFPISKSYSHPCMLITGNVKPDEYEKLIELVNKIDKDSFSKKYFIGISKFKDSYSLLTSEGNYRVEIGDLDNIEFKVKGFKTFVEKYLVYQDPEKYKMISLKFENQIVTTLNPHFKGNDSILQASHKELIKVPLSAPVKKIETKEKNKNTITKKNEKKTSAKPK